MNSFKTTDEILIFAITAEQEAVDFYNRLAQQSSNIEMKQIFKQYAHEEMGHKSKLMKIKEEGLVELSPEVIADLKISEYAVEVIPGPAMQYSDALLLAMKKEKAAYKLYNDLAAKAENEEIKLVFSTLAQEEAKHKLRFEIEYDEFVLKEN